MKKLKNLYIALYLCIGIGLFSNIGFSQMEIRHNSNGSVDWHFPTEAEAEAFKQKVLFQAKDVETLDSTIKYALKPAIEKGIKRENALDSALREMKYAGIECRNQVTQLQSELIEIGTKRKPLIEWIGFYGGMGTGYYFIDSVMTSQTIIDAMWNNIYVLGRGQVRIKDFMFTGALEIPLKGKTGIKLDISYRIF